MSRPFLVVVLLLLLSVPGSKAADTHTTPQDSASSPPTAAHAKLPVRVPDSEWLPLRANADPDLQRRLDAVVRARPAWSSLQRQRRLALAVVDLSDVQSIRFAAVNGDEMLYAASLPKIAILLAAVQSFEDGTLEEEAGILADLESMIRISDNPAATRLIDQLGMQRIQKVLTDPRYRLYDPAQNGGLWVGKPYAKAGEREPDPLHGLSHGATASQVARFYYLLATGRLVNPERSAQMLEILSDPGLHHKFVSALEQRSPRIRLHRKSGTWRNWHADSALVIDDDWRRYIIVALVQSENGEQILRAVPEAVETALREARSTP